VAAIARNSPRTPEVPMGSARDLYLDLMKRSLLNLIYAEQEVTFAAPVGLPKKLISALVRMGGAEVVRRKPLRTLERLEGRDWPLYGQTMVSWKRLENVQFCVEQVIQNSVPGDLIETGVWRGGVSILMRAVLKAYDVADRSVWVADSFAGLPPPNAEKYPQDKDIPYHTFDELVVSLDQVKHNFEIYGLLDDQVKFLKGWFKDTLAQAPIDRLAVMRLDGDMYESTLDALSALYPKLSIGGYVIIDDYGGLPACRQAVHDYREKHGITEKIVPVDWTGVTWQRQR
jgi:O-methyltransferase